MDVVQLVRICGGEKHSYENGVILSSVDAKYYARVGGSSPSIYTEVVLCLIW